MTLSSEEIIEWSADQIRRGSRSFAMASFLFAPEVRIDAHLLYSWCRYSDDVVDGQESGHRVGDSLPAPASTDQVACLRRDTEAAVSGSVNLSVNLSSSEHAPFAPAFQALSLVARRRGILVNEALDLITGFEWDARGRRYANEAELLQYCYHVAGVVGLMMTRVMGVTDQRAYPHAVALGQAMQLTNIARDLKDDALVGRVYVPIAWLNEKGPGKNGLSAEEFIDRKDPALFLEFAQRLLKMAEEKYAEGDRGLKYLPFRSRLAVAMAREVYHAIGDEILKRGHDAWTTRTSVSSFKKFFLMAHAFFRCFYSQMPS